MHPFNCHICRRQITARRPHIITPRKHVLCTRCTGTQAAHTLAAPDCPDAWHDGWDHEPVTASRAGATYFLGSTEATR